MEVESAPNNARRLYAGVDIGAPVSVVWGALTDYNGLGNFIPGPAASAPKSCVVTVQPCACAMHRTGKPPCWSACNTPNTCKALAGAARLETGSALQGKIVLAGGWSSKGHPGCMYGAGLAENRCVARRPNGAQLVQVGEQEIALGAKFRARIVLDVEVRRPAMLPLSVGLCILTRRRRGAVQPWMPGVSRARPGRITRVKILHDALWRQDGGQHLRLLGYVVQVRQSGVCRMQEFWGGLPSSRGGSSGTNGASTSGRGDIEHIEPRSPLRAPHHDLTFTSVEGDFQAGVFETSAVKP